MPLGVGTAVATSKFAGTLTSKPGSADVFFIVEVSLRIWHGRVAKKDRNESSECKAKSDYVVVQYSLIMLR